MGSPSNPAQNHIPAAQSEQVLTNSSFKCDFYCSNVLEQALCCSNIYLPSFFFKVFCQAGQPLALHDSAAGAQCSTA